ncbi:hypothetical protein [Vibrio owensii]|uniref:hypothetical protein n=1 Tax=Vibrio owensii TaxID=696485 RepID=UPI003CC6724B
MRKQYSKIKFNYEVFSHDQFGTVVKDLGLPCNNNSRLCDNVYYSIDDRMPFTLPKGSESDLKEVCVDESLVALKQFFSVLEPADDYALKLLVKQVEKKERALIARLA